MLLYFEIVQRKSFLLAMINERPDAQKYKYKENN
jgi:hypothetical protein